MGTDTYLLRFCVIFVLAFLVYIGVVFIVICVHTYIKKRYSMTSKEPKNKSIQEIAIGLGRKHMSKMSKVSEKRESKRSQLIRVKVQDKVKVKIQDNLVYIRGVSKEIVGEVGTICTKDQFNTYTGKGVPPGFFSIQDDQIVFTNGLVMS